MAKMLTQSRGSEIDSAEPQLGRRFAHIRDYVAKHAPSARHTSPDDEWMTEKRLLAAPLLVYHRADGEPEYIVSERVFRDVVCDRIAWRLALKNLKVADYLNHSLLGLLATRVFAKPLKIARVVSIKPEILQYRTEVEEQILRKRRQNERSR